MGDTEYRDVEDFPGYRIGSDGSIWTRWKHNGRNPRVLAGEWRLMKPQPDGDGYLALNLYCNGKPHRRKVHLLVLAAFKGKRPPGMQGCHEDGVLSNCAASNLRWDTPVNNQRDRLKHGTHCRGERSPKAKLTEELVRDALRRIHSGEMLSVIARDLNVAPSTVSALKSGRLWGWLRKAG